MASFVQANSNECHFEFIDTLNPTPKVLPPMCDVFDKHGYVIIRNLFDNTEVEKILKTLDDSKDFQQATFIVADAANTTYRQNQWIEPGTDMIGRLSGNAKVAGIAKQLLGQGELYMSNGKFVRKKPQSGGEVMWHQDFGDWFVRCDFVTVTIALTKSDSENGGLQIIDCGHKYGRPAHIEVNGQSTLDPTKVQWMLTQHPLIDVNLSAGDAVFFHGNMPHMSNGNYGSHARTNVIFNFIARSNGIDPTAAKFLNVRGEYPVFNALCGEYTLHEFDANAIKQCDDYTMHKRRFLDVNAPQTTSASESA